MFLAGFGNCAVYLCFFFKRAELPGDNPKKKWIQENKLSDAHILNIQAAFLKIALFVCFDKVERLFLKHSPGNNYSGVLASSSLKTANTENSVGI
jgi:hypothetical protein